MKICVFLHLFYPDMLDEFLDAISNLSASPELEYDLIVTTCYPDKVIEERIYTFKDNAKILIVPNRGYDLAPFLQALKTIDLKNYDYLIKLHSKRDLTTPAYLPFCSFKGNEWRKKLLEFMSSPDKIALTLKQFDQHPSLGMVSSPELIISAAKEDIEANLQAERIMRGMGLTLKEKKFIAGTMFIARAHLFRMWQNLPFDASDFEDFLPSHQGGTLAHALERVLGFMISAQGFEIGSYYPVGLKFKISTISYRLKNFVFYKRVNSKGKMHIKICKIPIYSKKM